jgi:PAS domain S-box-containing protein
VSKADADHSKGSEGAPTARSLTPARDVAAHPDPLAAPAQYAAEDHVEELTIANLLNSLATATVLLDRQLRIKILNPRVKSLFSLTDADIGRPLADLPPGFTNPELAADVTAACSNGIPSERQMRSESGAWYLRSVVPFRTETNEIQGAVVTFADVSQLKQAEQDAEVARANAAAIVGTVREPVAVVDPELAIMSANPAFCAAFDLAPDSIAGQALGSLGRPLLANPELLGLLARVLTANEAPGETDLEENSADDAQRTWRAVARRVQASPSACPMLLLVLNDVTDQRHVVRRQLQLLMDALPGAFIAVDRERCIRFVSGQMKPLFGYEPEELIGQKIDQLVPAGLRAQHAVMHAGYMDNPSLRPMGLDLDIEGVAKSGLVIPLDIGLAPLPTADGFLVVAAIHDLRIQKQAEVQLREAKAAADRANQAKSRFLAAASHDLRQPLQTIALLHSVLERRLVDPESRLTLMKLDRAATYMAELLDSLLDVNQLESGAIQPKFDDLELAPLLARAASDFAPLAEAKGLKLRVVPSSAIVYSDRRLLLRMVENLLSNGIKYTDHGKVLLGCRRRGNTLRIEVWDTGIGIAAENIDAIFEEFYRVDRADAGRSGLGLGLYIVLRFAQLLGHKVEIRSTPGKGTMLALIIADAQFAPLPALNDVEVPAGQSKPMVLVVEDEPIQVELLRMLLEIEGYRVTAVRTGDEALARLRGSADLRPDVIVTDFNLGRGMTGLEVIRQIRSELKLEIPALIVSGDSSSAGRAAIEASGFMFIAKPVKAVDLVAAIDALIMAERPERLRNGRSRATMAPASVPALDADVAVIDDDPGVRDGIRTMLAAEGYRVATYASAEAFLAETDRSHFRCLVVDLTLQGMSGLELQSKLKSGDPGLPIVFVTGSANLTMAVKAMREGAANFLVKPVGSADLRASVRSALAGQQLGVSSRAELAEVAARMATLTERERQVMDRVVAGHLTKNIAAELGISQRTTEHHRQAMMRKMGAGSLAGLVRMVASSGGL